MVTPKICHPAAKRPTTTTTQAAPAQRAESIALGFSRATLVYNVIPLFTVILSVLFLGESLMLYQILGGIAIIAGVTIGTTESSR